MQTRRVPSVHFYGNRPLCAYAGVCVYFIAAASWVAVPSALGASGDQHFMEKCVLNMN